MSSLLKLTYKLTFSFLLYCVSGLLTGGINYEVNDRAKQYARDSYKNSPNYFLAAKGISHFLNTSETKQKHRYNKKQERIALDFGCGTGILTTYIQQFGLNVLGADISQSMLDEAKKNLTGIDLVKINHIENGKNKLPFQSNSFDLVFSSFVLLEFGQESEIINVLKELRRVLKKDGQLIIVLTSEEVYKYKKNSFVASRTNFPENESLVSGSKVKLQLSSLSYPFEDYFWSTDDYFRFMKSAGFKNILTHYPLGTKEDENILSIKWQSETHTSPIVIYKAT